jgi:2-oxoisovalerate dehydrogenase E1 component
MGLQYKELMGLFTPEEAAAKPISVCSIGDAAMTEGEVAEALQMAALKQFPLLFVVQDNGWDISANAAETRAQNAAEYAAGFKGIRVLSVDGSDYSACRHALQDAIKTMRETRQPHLLHARVPLLNHHTSGVRKEWYRDDLEEHALRDPLPKLQTFLLDNGFTQAELNAVLADAESLVAADYQRALAAEDPRPEDLLVHAMAPTPAVAERGERAPEGKERTVMVDCALFALREVLEQHPEALLYGQDVGHRLGGVFREAATLAQQFGSHRVFNTPIQEAFIIGSTVGMSAVGLKPIVEVQFADYIWPGLNQLFTELSRSYYLSNGKWPASAVVRVPIGAYGSGGPYHSSSVESIVTNIAGIKVAYPSTGADLKGLMKAAFLDPNPVLLLEHKGLYWSKIKGTEGAKTVEPSEDYVLPFGVGRRVLEAEPQPAVATAVVVTYGMGVYWSLEAAQKWPGRVEVIDLRTLAPWDEELVVERVQAHGRCLVVTEEMVGQTFAQAVAGRISDRCFAHLDAPVRLVGSVRVPAIPLNKILEATLLPNADKVAQALEELLAY